MSLKCRWQKFFQAEFTNRLQDSWYPSWGFLAPGDVRANKRDESGATLGSILMLLCCCRPWLLCRGTQPVRWLSRCLTARTSWVWCQAWGCGICLWLVCRCSGAGASTQFYCRHKHSESTDFMSAFLTRSTCLHFTLTGFRWWYIQLGNYHTPLIDWAAVCFHTQAQVFAKLV